MNAAMKYVLFVVGIGACAFSYMQYEETQSFVERAVSTSGEVIRLVERESSSDNNRISEQREGVKYFPVIRFKTKNDQFFEFEANVGGSPSPYKVGELVEVLYTPEDPENFRIKSLFGLWSGSLVPGGVGIFFILFSIIQFVLSSRRIA